MRAPDHHHHATHLFILSLFASFIVPHQLTSFPDLISNQTIPRRLLHQPLFPVTSAPPPEPPPPPPPPPSSPNSDQPFFPEAPNNPDQTQPQPPPPPPANGTTAAAVANPVATQPIKPAKKVAIAISVGIVTLGMLSALAFYLYKHRVKHSGDSQKLVGANSQRFHDESRPPPSSFLYIGTVEPTNESSVEEGTNGLVLSPYRKLGSPKRSDRYRPSPELQPLPPLPKPPLPIMNSPPPMSSSDEESRETEFYTPQCSLVSNDDGSSTPGSRRSWVAARGKAEGGATTTTTTNSVPFSKRTSPKTRISFSPPNPKLTIIPSIKQTPRPPPPPPPPPPPISTPRKLEGPEASVTSIPSQELRKLQSRIPNSKANFEKARPEELNNGFDSSERTDGDDADGSKPRLKPLHWDKVRATSDRATVWDQLKSSSFQLNEDMMETLFGCNSTNSVPKAPKEVTRKSVLPPVKHENRVLDPKKSQNIAILLRALNVTRDEVSEALLDGNPEGLGSDLLETLVKMAPTKEEEIKLRDYKGDISKLGSAERFLKTVLDIPFAFKRVEAMLYRANFDTEVKYLRKSFQTLEVASEELKNSRLFLKLLEAVLRTGNRMNVGTNRGDATAFKLETLLKLVDIKGTDGKTTLLHFVVQEIIRSEGTGSDPTTENLPNKMNSKLKEEDFKNQGLQVVAGLSRELGNVKKAAGMDSDVLNSYVSKLETGLEKVRLVLQYEKPNMQGKFFESMKTFLKEADDEINGIKVDERMALSLVKEVTEYFHGNAAKEEAHPLRIFMIVRDFLSILDNVCKEVGRLQDNTMVGSARSFRIPANASLPVLNRYNVRHDTSSDEESSSP